MPEPEPMYPHFKSMWAMQAPDGDCLLVEFRTARGALRFTIETGELFPGDGESDERRVRQRKDREPVGEPARCVHTAIGLRTLRPSGFRSLARWRSFRETFCLRGRGRIAKAVGRALAGGARRGGGLPENDVIEALPGR
jgi:hypothetical protein